LKVGNAQFPSCDGNILTSETVRLNELPPETYKFAVSGMAGEVSLTVACAKPIWKTHLEKYCFEYQAFDFITSHPGADLATCLGFCQPVGWAMYNVPASGQSACMCFQTCALTSVSNGITVYEVNS